MSAPIPLVLPRIGRADARAASARSVPRAPLQLPGIGAWLTIDAGGTGSCGPDPMRVDLTWAGHGLAVRCAGRWLAGVYDALGAEFDVAGRPPDLAALLLEAAFLPAIEAVESATGAEIRIRAVAPDAEPPAAEALALLIEDGERRSGLHVAPDAAGRDALADLLARWPVAPRPAETLPFPAALRLGVTTLTVSDLRSLRPGDAVLLEVGRRGGGMVVVAGTWLAEAERQGAAWQFEAALRPARSRDEKEWTMQDEDDAVPEDAELVGDPDDLPVRLAFDVGRLELSLGELRRLDVGSVLGLDRSREELVRISANGRPVGQGTLVDVDGAVGVRIERMFDLG